MRGFLSWLAAVIIATYVCAATLFRLGGGNIPELFELGIVPPTPTVGPNLFAISQPQGQSYPVPPPPLLPPQGTAAPTSVATAPPSSAAVTPTPASLLGVPTVSPTTPPTASPPPGTEPVQAR